MTKILTARKHYKCDYCMEDINVGDKYRFESSRQPKYDIDDAQIGISYWHGRFCFDIAKCIERYEKDFAESENLQTA